MEKINPKKKKMYRRVRAVLTGTVSRKMMMQSTGTCKTCIMRPRAHGSSRCETCTQEYYDSIKSNRNT